VVRGNSDIRENYPETPVYGHGEVNPGHKQADEGMAITNAIRQERESHERGPINQYQRTKGGWQ
jgi:hypothetical protein